MLRDLASMLPLAEWARSLNLQGKPFRWTLHPLVNYILRKHHLSLTKYQGIPIFPLVGASFFPSWEESVVFTLIHVASFPVCYPNGAQN